MLQVQAIFSPLSAENSCENFSISKIGLFFFKKKSSYTWNCETAVLEAYMIARQKHWCLNCHSVCRAEEQTFACGIPCHEDVAKHFMWLNIAVKSFQCHFYLWYTPNFKIVCFHRSLKRSRVIFFLDAFLLLWQCWQISADELFHAAKLTENNVWMFW